ncbi:MAG: hypothetical protein ACOX8X_03800 [Methanomethylophilus sp.]
MAIAGDITDGLFTGMMLVLVDVFFVFGCFHLFEGSGSLGSVEMEGWDRKKRRGVHAFGGLMFIVMTSSFDLILVAMDLGFDILMYIAMAVCFVSVAISLVLFPSYGNYGLKVSIPAPELGHRKSVAITAVATLVLVLVPTAIFDDGVRDGTLFEEYSSDGASAEVSVEITVTESQAVNIEENQTSGFFENSEEIFTENVEEGSARPEAGAGLTAPAPS